MWSDSVSIRRDHGKCLEFLDLSRTCWGHSPRQIHHQFKHVQPVSMGSVCLGLAMDTAQRVCT